MYKKIYSALLAGKLEVTPVKKPEVEPKAESNPPPASKPVHTANPTPSSTSESQPRVALESPSHSRQIDNNNDYHPEPHLEHTTGYSPQSNLELNSGYASESSSGQYSGYSPDSDVEQISGYSPDPRMEQNVGFLPEPQIEQTSGYRPGFNPEPQTDFSAASQHDYDYDLDLSDETEHQDIFDPLAETKQQNAFDPLDETEQDIFDPLSETHRNLFNSPDNTEQQEIFDPFTDRHPDLFNATGNSEHQEMFDPVENSDDQNFLQPRDHEMINLVDEGGNPFAVNRYQWRNIHLPRHLQENWHHPEQLVSVVMQALQDEFFAEIDEATHWLLQTDSNHERAYCLRSIVLMKLNKNDAAEQLLFSYLESNPKTGYILTNLAKAQDAQGDHELAIQTLEEGLVIDPNQENGLDWWLSIYQEDAQERGVEANQAYFAALSEASQRFPGWRIHLRLGSYYADQKQIENAIYYFNAVINDQYYPEALYAISGDLGKNGFVAEVIDLVAPLYIPEQHEPYIGLNLLSAYFTTQRVEEGEALLQKMFNLNNPSIQQHLLMFEQEFSHLRGVHQQVEETASNHQVDESVSIHPFFIEEPLWLEGLGDLGARFKLKKTGKKIALIQFTADIASTYSEAANGRSSQEGNIARAIPCYLLESLYLGSALDSTVVIPLADDNSNTLFSDPLSHEEIRMLQSQGGFSGALTGRIEGEELSLVYWDLENDQQQAITVQLDVSNCNSAVLQTEEFLINAAQIDFDPHYRHPNNKLSSGNEYKRVAPEYMHAYILALAEFLGRIPYSEQEKAATIRFGEFGSVRLLLDIAMDVPVLQTQLLFMSTLALAMKNNSPAITKTKNQILFWLKSHAEMPGHLQALAEQLSDKFQAYCEMK